MGTQHVKMYSVAIEAYRLGEEWRYIEAKCILLKLCQCYSELDCYKLRC